MAYIDKSNTNEWETPLWLFKTLNNEYHFDLDPCSTDDNAKCKRHFTAEQDGLKQEWSGRVFMNPPYGRVIAKWVKKAYESVMGGGTQICVCLLPSRTDTAWFHEYCMKGEVWFVKGRLRFNNSKENAPFPSMIVIFDKDKMR